MDHLGTARRLSWAQRESLMAHIDREIPVERDRDVDRVRNSLIGADLLCPEPRSGKPHFTRLSMDGRGVVCHLLGMYADALSRVDPEMLSIPWREKLAELKVADAVPAPVLSLVELLTKSENRKGSR